MDNETQALMAQGKKTQQPTGAVDITKPHWRCACGAVAMPLTDNTPCQCADIYQQDWRLIEPQDLPAAGPWVPVGERLPELIRKEGRSTRVLALTRGAAWTALYWSYGEWTDVMGSPLSHVTHWAEIRLPEVRG